MLAASGVAGFFEVFLQFLLNEAWTDEFEPYLENNCSGGIYSVGHSQGKHAPCYWVHVALFCLLGMISSMSDRRDHHDWFDLVRTFMPTS